MSNFKKIVPNFKDNSLKESMTILYNIIKYHRDISNSKGLLRKTTANL
jgi:hypothetical protein